MSEFSHAELAAHVLVQGCIPYVEGRAVANMPVAGVELPPEQRATLISAVGSQLTSEGKTFFYPVQQTGVFCDFSPGAISVWFEGHDAARAITVFETELQRAYPNTNLMREWPHPVGRDMAVRIYLVPLGNGGRVLVEAAFPGGAQAQPKFAAWVVPVQAGQSPASAAGSPAGLAALLATETVIDMMLGVSSSAPAPTASLSAEQRQFLGLEPGGSTLVYELGEASLLLDMVANTATMSFAKGDVSDAISILDDAIARRRPQLLRIEDVTHPRGGSRRLRVYQGELQPNLICKVEADYPSAGATGLDNRFVVRVSAYARQF